jgi:hypothetical protein
MASPLAKNVLESTISSKRIGIISSYLLPLVSTTSFTEWYAKYSLTLLLIVVPFWLAVKDELEVRI